MIEIKKIHSFLSKLKPSFLFIWLASLPLCIIFFILFYELIPTRLSYFKSEINSYLEYPSVFGTVVFFTSTLWFLIKKNTNKTNADQWLNKVYIVFPVAIFFILIFNDRCTGFMCLLSFRELITIFFIVLYFQYAIYKLISYSAKRLIIKIFLALVAFGISSVICFSLGQLGDSLYETKEDISNWYEKEYCNKVYNSIDKKYYFSCIYN